MTLPLRSYQLEGVKFLNGNRRGLLADEPGLGKSAQLIRAAEGRTLIVAPAMVLDSGTWVDEIARWADDPSRFSTVAYSMVNARKTVDTGRTRTYTSKVTGESWEQKVYRQEILPTIVRADLRQDWDTLILDEAHYIKNRDANWTQALVKLARRIPLAFLATGTPISHYAFDLFPQLQILFPMEAKRNGPLGSYWRWAGEWFDTTPETIYVGGREKQIQNVGGMLACTNLCSLRPPHDPCEHYREFFESNFRGRFLQRLRDDVLSELPPLTSQQVQCPMTKKQAAAYKKMATEFLAEDLDGNVVAAWSASAKHVQLEKISTSLGLLGAGELVRESGKLERLRFDLQGRTRPTFVVAHYRKTVEACEWVARELGLRVAHVHGGTSRPDRHARIQAFKSGELDVLVGSISTVAEGMTLTQADMVILVEHSWRPSHNQQVVRRIHRMGQTRPCTMLDYVTPGTIDEGKRESLQHKLDHQARVLTWGQLKPMIMGSGGSVVE